MTSNTRVYAQYKDKPKAVKWFDIIPTVADDITNVYQDVRTSYDIDAAVGEQLNVIGRIVVLDRSYESKVIYGINTYFGADTLASQFGGAGAQFNAPGTTITQEVSDAIFRVLIRAKIAKNNSDSTLDGIVKALSYITSSSNIQVIDNEDMTFSVSFGSELNDVERFVFDTFDVTPRPQGVQFLGYTEETSITQWGGSFSWGDTRANFGQYFGA